MDTFFLHLAQKLRWMWLHTWWWSNPGGQLLLSSVHLSDNIKCYIGTCNSIRAAPVTSRCLTVYLEIHQVCLGGNSSQLCSDLPNLIMLLHAGMYLGQAPACTFHTNNLPLGIRPGSLPQGPFLQTGSFVYWGSSLVLTTALPKSLLKAIQYRTKFFSLFWPARARFYIAYPYIF